MRSFLKRLFLILFVPFVIALIAGVIFFNRSFYWKQDYSTRPVIESSFTKVKTKDYQETKHAYFGDLHIHTGWSFDAFIYNVRTTPDDAYRYAKGYKIPHVSGDSIQINRPLDFMAVTDHAEYMQVMMQMLDEKSSFAKLDLSKRCLLYTSPSPRDQRGSRMPSSA